MYQSKSLLQLIKILLSQKVSVLRLLIQNPLVWLSSLQEQFINFSLPKQKRSLTWESGIKSKQNAIYKQPHMEPVSTELPAAQRNVPEHKKKAYLRWTSLEYW